GSDVKSGIQKESRSVPSTQTIQIYIEDNMPGAQNDSINVTPKVQKPVAPAATPVPTKRATEPVHVFSTTSPFMNATIHL
ncbi:hypothetical protein HDU99_002193, partial [Rhizoclosmatium hyalinum]